MQYTEDNVKFFQDALSINHVERYEKLEQCKNEKKPETSLFLGKGFEGSISDLNIWSQILLLNEIQGMTASVSFVNDDLLNWKERSHHYKHNFVEESEALLPGKKKKNQCRYSI